MHSESRRKFLSLTLKSAAALSFYPLYAYAANPCNIQHPLMPPDMNMSGQCPNCGMVRPMWARTWKTFENSEGKSEACSFHCLADVALKSGEDPKNVLVALYTEPQKMIPAEKAFYVVGSKAPGTMTMKSKIAFATKSEAEKFAKECGGSVMGYAETLQIAKDGINKENQMIVQRRLKKGKIVEPVDNKDRCPVCGMYPARYPKNKCQIQTKGKDVFHFCSTQCLFVIFGRFSQIRGQRAYNRSSCGSSIMKMAPGSAVVRPTMSLDRPSPARWVRKHLLLIKMQMRKNLLKNTTGKRLSFRA